MTGSTNNLNQNCQNLINVLLQKKSFNTSRIIYIKQKESDLVDIKTNILTHHFFQIKAQNNMIFCLQFTVDGILFHIHDCSKDVDQCGKVKQVRLRKIIQNIDLTVKDVINFVTHYNDKYIIKKNDCQTFAKKFNQYIKNTKQYIKKQRKNEEKTETMNQKIQNNILLFFQNGLKQFTSTSTSSKTSNNFSHNTVQNLYKKNKKYIPRQNRQKYKQYQRTQSDYKSQIIQNNRQHNDKKFYNSNIQDYQKRNINFFNKERSFHQNKYKSNNYKQESQFIQDKKQYKKYDPIENKNKSKYSQQRYKNAYYVDKQGQNQESSNKEKYKQLHKTFHHQIEESQIDSLIFNQRQKKNINYLLKSQQKNDKKSEKESEIIIERYRQSQNSQASSYKSYQSRKK